MSDWTTFGVRQRDRDESARTRPDEPHPRLTGLHARALRSMEEPFAGITTDGTVVPGLFDGQPGTRTEPVLEAALEFLSVLNEDQRSRVLFAPGADEQRMWLNIQPYVFRHGIMLEDLSEPQRKLALAVVKASYSGHAFQTIRDVMRINDLVGDVTGKPDMYGEWPYFFSFFGAPSADEPWSWQLDGHHVNINCTIAGDQLAFTPAFLGSEPCNVTAGRLAGTDVFVVEQRAGLDMIRSLSTEQLEVAVVNPLMEKNPDNPMAGRMRFDAFRDNALAPPAGIRGDALTDAQRRLLLGLVGTYVGWAEDGAAAARMQLVERHLDETWFQWMGSTGDKGPFYYQVLSPVTLVEFDHQPGVVFDNTTPTHNHIHTVVRTPNGGDYGFDLLGHHHEQFDHSHGRHD